MRESEGRKVQVASLVTFQEIANVDNEKTDSC